MGGRRTARGRDHVYLRGEMRLRSARHAWGRLKWWPHLKPTRRLERAKNFTSLLRALSAGHGERASSPATRALSSASETECVFCMLRPRARFADQVASPLWRVRECGNVSKCFSGKGRLT